MYNIDYDFSPGDTVFTVIDDIRLEEATVLDIKFKVYQNNVPTIITVVTYTLLLADAGEGTVTVDSSVVFGTLQDAVGFIAGELTPTPTPSITPTMTVTPTITPTNTPASTVTPTVTPTSTVTPTTTPTTTVTPTVTPTSTVTPTATPTPTVTTSTVPIGQTLLILEDNLVDTKIVSQHVLSTPNILSTATSTGDILNISPEVVDPSGMCTNPTGTLLFILDNSDKTIHKYSLAVPWQLATATNTGQTYTLTADNHNLVWEIAFNYDGTKIYILQGNGADELHEHNVGTPFDLSTIDDADVYHLSVHPEKFPTALFFGDSGSSVYVGGNDRLRVERFEMSTPYLTSTAVSTQTFNLNVASDRFEGLSFSADGSKMFAYMDGILRTYQTSPAWSLENPILLDSVGSYSPISIGNGRSFILEPV